MDIMENGLWGKICVYEMMNNQSRFEIELEIGYWRLELELM
jgi:hypothetical protein